MTTREPITLALLRSSHLALLLSGLAGLAGCRGEPALAKVGKAPITAADLQTFRERRSHGGDSDPRKDLDALVERTLLAEEARREGLQRDPGLRVRLAALEREMLAQALLEKKLAAATEEPALRKRYEERKGALARRTIHVQQIVVRIEAADAGSRAKAQAAITRAYDRLSQGESFETVAREASEDPATAAKGGDLGRISEGQVAPAFFAVGAGLKRGETSKPFETQFGFHLMRALEDPALVTPTFEEARGPLAAEVRREEQAKLMADLRERLGVRVFEERLSGLKRARRQGEAQ